MKSMIAIILALALCLALPAGCGTKQGKPAPGAADKGAPRVAKDGTVRSVEATSFPERFAYTFTGDAAQAVLDYLLSLQLSEDSENRHALYSGITWQLDLAYDDGDEMTVYHSGTYIQTKDGPFYKMDDDEAVRLYSLLDELNGSQ